MQPPADLRQHLFFSSRLEVVKVCKGLFRFRTIVGKNLSKKPSSGRQWICVYHKAWIASMNKVNSEG